MTIHGVLRRVVRNDAIKVDPPEVYNWRIYAFAIIVSFGVLAYGYDSAFIGTTITRSSFRRDFGIAQMSKAEQNNVSSNLTSICEFTSKAHSALTYSFLYSLRLCWRFLRRTLHVLQPRAARPMVEHRDS